MKRVKSVSSAPGSLSGRSRCVNKGRQAAERLKVRASGFELRGFAKNLGPQAERRKFFVQRLFVTTAPRFRTRVLRYGLDNICGNSSVQLWAKFRCARMPRQLMLDRCA